MQADLGNRRSEPGPALVLLYAVYGQGGVVGIPGLAGILSHDLEEFV